MLPVAIIAGGLATRLRPATEKIPKALVDVAGQAFIIRQLRYLHGQGIARAVLCIGYRGEQIEAAVGDGAWLGLDVRYSQDGMPLLGTGGALRRALPLLGDAFFVIYGDSFLPIDFRRVAEAFVAGRKPALMTVLRNGDRWDRSNAHFEGGLVRAYDKHAPRSGMAYIDYGLSILSADVLARHADGEVFDLADVFHGLAATGDLAGFEVVERFYEIGSREGLAETEAYFRARNDG